MENELKYNKWVKYPNGHILPSDDIVVIDNLDSEIYRCYYSDKMGEYFLIANSFVHDNLIHHESDEYNIIMEEIKSFWNMGDEYKKNKYVHKRGMLLAGAPGTGKTSLINLCLEWYFKEIKGIVISVSNYNELACYSALHKLRIREIEPSRPIICIFEDIDGYVQNGGDGESILLNLLDGNNQIDDVMYICTTNYPERLTDRLSRPGRFDVKVEIKFPTRKEREIYLENKLGSISNIKEWLDETENKTMAFISEMVKQFKIYKNPLPVILDKLDSYAKIAKSSVSFNKEEKVIGFNHK